MHLSSISNEQQSVIDSLVLDYNIIVDSVAGSGKTTCNLHIAKHFTHFNILLLTYNAKLKIETREKVSKLKIHNLETQSYHSFCVKHYDTKCYTDTVINNILERKQSLFDIIDYDIIIIDEAQDMSPLYYQLVCKIYKDNMKCAKICIVGDKFQSIFQFNGSDERFITMANKIFTFNPLPWKVCKLSTSFRITFEMSEFINNCMLKESRIISCKVSSNKPRYLFGDYNCNLVFEEVKYYLLMGYKPEDIFILAPSIKSENSPIKKLENLIKLETNVNVYAAGDNEKIDDDIIKEKLVFATFHQTKGLERKVTIVFNFDNSYFKFYNKDVDPFICPNELYVAVTRGIDRLTIIHGSTNSYLPFLNTDKLEKYCDVIGSSKLLSINKKEEEIKKTSPTQLISHLPSNILDKCIKLLQIEEIRPLSNIIHISSKTNKNLKNNSTCECVSELTGVAIPTYFELQTKGTINIHKSLLDEYFLDNNKKGKTKINENILQRLKNLNIENITPEDLLFLVNCWDCQKSKLLFKMYQIISYDWLPYDKLMNCVDRLTSLRISNNACFEKQYDTYDYKNEKSYVIICDLQISIVGYVDCIDLDNNNLYEFKCVSELSVEHYLQLAIYMYLDKYRQNLCENRIQNCQRFITSMGTVTDKHIHYNIIQPEIEIMNSELEHEIQYKSCSQEMNYYLYNILTDELIRIKCTFESLYEIMTILITNKYMKSKRITDDEFFIKINEIRIQNNCI